MLSGLTRRMARIYCTQTCNYLFPSDIFSYYYFLSDRAYNVYVVNTKRGQRFSMQRNRRRVPDNRIACILYGLG